MRSARRQASELRWSVVVAKMRACNSLAVRTRKSLDKFVEGAVVSGMVSSILCLT